MLGVEEAGVRRCIRQEKDREARTDSSRLRKDPANEKRNGSYRSKEAIYSPLGFSLHFLLFNYLQRIFRLCPFLRFIFQNHLAMSPFIDFPDERNSLSLGAKAMESPIPPTTLFSFYLPQKWVLRLFLLAAKVGSTRFSTCRKSGLCIK